jgi:hypothetical protein
MAVRGPVDRVEPGEGEPGLVPQEHQIRLDRQALLHDPVDVVDDPVERAVGQQEHPDPVQLARLAQRQQLALDLGERHGAVHLEGVRAGERPEPFDGTEHVEQAVDGLTQGLDRALLRPGQRQLGGGFLQAAPGIVSDLPQAVIRQRVRHGDPPPRCSSGSMGGLAGHLSVTLP